MRAYTFALGCFMSMSVHSFDLKGYALGQPMTECPAGSSLYGPKRPIVSCNLGATTVANQPAHELVVGFFEGQVVTIYARLNETGKVGNFAVRDALMEKFGPPTSGLTKSHINQYGWLREGSQMMMLDGWKGTLVLQDMEASKKARQQSAGSNKSDL